VISRAQRRVLRELANAEEPLFNGTLAARAGLAWNTALFATMVRKELIAGGGGYPFELLPKGREALTSAYRKDGE
jgi:hypothetical protein